MCVTRSFALCVGVTRLTAGDTPVDLTGAYARCRRRPPTTRQRGYHQGCLAEGILTQGVGGGEQWRRLLASHSHITADLAHCNSG